MKSKLGLKGKKCLFENTWQQREFLKSGECAKRLQGVGEQVRRFVDIFLFEIIENSLQNSINSKYFFQNSNFGLNLLSLKSKQSRNFSTKARSFSHHVLWTSKQQIARQKLLSHYPTSFLKFLLLNSSSQVGTYSPT